MKDTQTGTRSVVESMCRSYGGEYSMDGTSWDSVKDPPPGLPASSGADPLQMDYEEEMQHGASISQTFRGKRKKPVSERDQETSTEDDAPARRKSKSGRTQQIVSDEDRPSMSASTRVMRSSGKKEVVPPKSGPFKISQTIREMCDAESDPSTVRDSDAATVVSQSCSEMEEQRKGLSKRELKLRAPPRKKKVDEPTIEEMLRPVPRQLDALEIAPTSQSIAAIKEWLKDIELIRGRSSYQGVLSKRIKERVATVKQLMDLLAIKVEGKEDIEYQKRRNAELQAQLLASQREITRMGRRIDELQRILEEVRRYMVTDGQMPKCDKATSPLAKMEEEPRKSQREKQNRKGSLPAVKEDAVVMRPPIKGVSVPIPVSKDRSNFKSEDAELSRQIVELVARRKKLRRDKANTSSDRSADPSPMDSGRQPKKSLPK